MRRQRIGRNDPCPCGSGLKFKKCCLREGVSWEQEERDDKGAIRRQSIAPPPEPDEAQLARAAEEMAPALEAAARPSVEPPFPGEVWVAQRVGGEEARRRFIDYFKAYRVGLFDDQARMPHWVKFIEDVSTEHAEPDEEGRRASTDDGVIQMLGIAIALREKNAGLLPHQCFELAAVTHDYANHYLRAVVFPRDDQAARAAVQVIQMGLALLDNYMIMWLIDAIDHHFGIEPGSSMISNTGEVPAQAPEEEAPADAAAAS